MLQSHNGTIAARGAPETTNYQLPTTNYQLPTTNYQRTIETRRIKAEDVKERMLRTPRQYPPRHFIFKI